MNQEVIKIEDVKTMIGVRSDATVYCKLNPKYANRYDPSFPRPFKIGGGTFWKRSEVESWIDDQMNKNQL
jgi:predicted DNA-binding transcriptional regulator AlpA